MKRRIGGKETISLAGVLGQKVVYVECAKEFMVRGSLKWLSDSLQTRRSAQASTHGLQTRCQLGVSLLDFQLCPSGLSI